MSAGHIAIFGGCGAIGSAVARAASEFEVSAIDRLAESPSCGHRCDVREPESIRAALSAASALHGPIDHVVYTCGVYDALDWEDTDADAMRRVWEINCLGFMNVAKTWSAIPGAPPHASSNVPSRASANATSPVKQGRRFLVAVTSAAARLRGRDVAYASSKAALESLVRGVARPLANLGILACGVAPGIVDSPMARRADAARFTAHEAANLHGKAAQPEDIAAIVLAILRHDLRYLVGGIVDADAGAAF